MRSRTVFGVAAALALTWLASGCAPSEPPAPEPEVTVVMGQRSVDLNPYSPLDADRRIGRLMFRGLMAVGPDGMPQPDLAVEVPTVANGGISKDGRRVVYHIRDDAVWHDGRPVTARDVAFTIELIRSGLLTDDPAESVGALVMAEATDDRTVELEFSSPDSVLAWRLAPYVLPEHLLGDTEHPEDAAFWIAPVGCGPYAVERLERDGRVRLRPFDGSSGAPRLTVIGVADPGEALRAFDSAEVAVWLDAEQGAVGASESRDVTWGPVWRRIVFDCSPSSAWRDPALRRAISLMTTRTVPAGLPVAAYPYGAAPERVSVPDTRTAAKLFGSRGWVVGAEGVRRRDGAQLIMKLGVPVLRPWEGVRYRALTGVWRSAGVRADIYGASSPYRPTWSEGGTVIDRDRQAVLLTGPLGRPYGWAWPFFADDVPSWKREWGLNLGHFRDPVADAAVRSARGAPDPETARRRMAEAGARIQALDAEIYLEPVEVNVLYKGLTGVRAWPIAEEALAQAPRWRITSSGASTAAAVGRGGDRE